mgnify:FL=1
MKKIVAVVLICMLAIYFSDLILVKKSPAKQPGKSIAQEANVELKNNQPIIDTSAHLSKTSSVDFVPAKETLLNASSSEKPSYEE